MYGGGNFLKGNFFVDVVIDEFNCVVDDGDVGGFVFLVFDVFAKVDHHIQSEVKHLFDAMAFFRLFNVGLAQVIDVFLFATDLQNGVGDDADRNDAAYGFIEDGFRAYLECMRNWYEKGWLDNKFNTRSTDNFYAIDNATIAAGEVGLWMGNASRLGARMASDKQDSHANGAIVYGCSTPVNDIPSYDGDPSTTAYTVQAPQSEAETAIAGGKGSNYMLQQPYVMFQNEQISSNTVIAASVANGKDLTLLLSFFDFLYGDEGATMKLMGLNAEQAKDSKLYAEYGFTGGAYTVNEDGTYSYDPVLEQNAENIRYAMTLYRIPGLSQYSKVRYSFAETYVNSRAQWTKFPATGFIAGMINGQCTPDETDTISNIVQPIQESYLFKNVYKFILGDWELSNAQGTSYCASVMNYTNRNTKVQSVLDVYDAVFDRLYGTEN